jgi:hypothetical protein
MRINPLAGALVLSAGVQVSCVVAADGQPVVADNPPEANLLALVGRRSSVQYVEPEGNEVKFDAEYRVRIEVLQVLFGRYPAKEMEFSSFVHVGRAAFQQDEFGLVYISRYEGRFVQQKYLFQPLHRTYDGHLAGCGDPYGWMPDVHRHGVRAEPIAFSPPVTFDVGKRAQAQGFTSFSAPYFRIQSNIASCVMGNYPEDLFRVMAEGYLKARRVLDPTAEEI